MGFDCGFDIHPRLEVNAENKQVYRQFLDEIIQTYQHVYDEEGSLPNGKILNFPNTSERSDKNNIRLMIGSCPQMPSNPERCNYFLRFNSEVSGRLTAPAEPYIRNVCKIAKKHFGSKAHFWHELCETGDQRQWGFYSWKEVTDAEEELRELESKNDKSG